MRSSSLQKQVSGAVANSNGHEYDGYYPIDGQDLTFGAQAIDVVDAARFMIQESGIDDLLLETG
jgi:hypothetical protein